MIKKYKNIILIYSEFLKNHILLKIDAPSGEIIWSYATPRREVGAVDGPSLYNSVEGTTTEENFQLFFLSEPQEKFFVKHYQYHLDCNQELIDAEIFLTGDTEICNGDTSRVTISMPYQRYWWSTGDTTQSVDFYDPVNFVIQVFDGLCWSNTSDSIQFKVKEIPEIPLLVQNGEYLIAPGGFSSYIWYLNDSIIAQDVDSIRLIQSGNYKVEVFNEGGCSSISEEFSLTVVGISPSINNYLNYLLFPNPSKGKFQIHINDSQYIFITIYNVSGKVVKRISNYKSDSIIEINSNPGLYIIEIQTDEDQYLFKILLQ